jgi:hypothetical protein
MDVGNNVWNSFPIFLLMKFKNVENIIHLYSCALYQYSYRTVNITPTFAEIFNSG